MEKLSKFIPTSWTFGFLSLFFRVCSLNAHEVSVAKRVSQEMGVTWMQSVCKQLAIQGWRDFLLPWDVISETFDLNSLQLSWFKWWWRILWGFMKMQENRNLGLSCTAWFLAILVRILWKAQAQEIRWWATRALSAMWVCERVSRVSLQFSLQIRVEWYDERSCSICFRIRLEKKVAYLELGLMDCSVIIKSSCIKRTTEQSDKLHEFHDSDVRSTGGKLYTSPVLHRSCPRLFSNRVVADG